MQRTNQVAQQYIPEGSGPMNTSLTLRPLAAFAASSLLLYAVVIAAFADEAPEQTVGNAAGAVGCESALPDNPKTGPNLGPMFQRAV